HVVTKGNRLIIGEPFSEVTPRVQQIISLFAEAGFAAQGSNNIRLDIWSKLLANATYNPVSFLTLSSNTSLFEDPRTYQLLIKTMSELIAGGSALGIDGNFNPAARIEASIKTIGDSKTSMLQELEAGRPVEVDSILSAPIE